uniref:Ig-like domain-containing protein n=1 Tax=Cyprinus carpio TaxID=7962 RepID=A0A8C1Y5P7_CYPCA
MIIFTLLTFLWMCMGHTEANIIKPFSLIVNRHVGDGVNLSCSYKDYTGAVNNLQWYRQYPRSKPEFLLYILQNGDMSEDRPPRFTAAVNKDNRQVDLKISPAEETDSAMYYCALVPTVTGNPTASNKNLPCHH